VPSATAIAYGFRPKPCAGLTGHDGRLRPGPGVDGRVEVDDQGAGGVGASSVLFFRARRARMVTRGQIGSQTEMLAEGEMSTPVVDKVVEQLQGLPYELQWRVLEFTRALAVSIPRGLPGRQLLRFAGAIPSNDLQIMRQAIKEGCEQIAGLSTAAW